MHQPLHLCVMATIGKSIQVLYTGRLEYFQSNGFNVTVVCAPSELDNAIRARGVRLFTAPLTRAITPLADLRALWQLVRFFRRERFDIVEVSTPKAALIGSMAARLAGTPTVIHLLQGLAYEGKQGLEGWLVRKATQIPCQIAHQTLSVSPSMRDEVLAAGFCDKQHIRVLGYGTGSGVNLERLHAHGSAERAAAREKCKLSNTAIVFGFVGRMVRDKGVENLVSAFEVVHQAHTETALLFVGDYEERDRPSNHTIETISSHPGIRHVGWQNDVVPFLAAMDVFVLPTYREGFGVVLLEAAATGLPTITTRVTGARDANVDGVTGLQVPSRDSSALAEAMMRLLEDPDLRARFGQAGREWVRKNFDQKDVWQRQVDLYRELAARP